MKKILTTITLAILIIVAGCTNLDDVYRQIDEHDRELTTLEAQLRNLEQLMNKANSEVLSIKGLVDALNKKVSVVSYKELADKSGYELTMSDGSKITLKHGAKGEKGDPGKEGDQGKKGDDGITPAINVKLHTDGLLYWTINGEWLRDANGNMVPAEGKDGEDGKPGAPGANGITPQLRINADFHWEVSFDEGRTWKAIKDADGNPIPAQGSKGEPGQDGDANLTITEVGNSIIIEYKGKSYILPKFPTMTLTTDLAVLKTIKLKIDAAEEDRPYVWIDLNNNGKKDDGEAVTKFGENVEYTLGAQTVTVFGKVTELVSNSNQLTSLDVSNNTALTKLSCFDNQLTSLDLSKNSALKELFCYRNQLTSLDVSKNTELMRLSCGNDSLKVLDVSHNLALKILNCSRSALSALDVSNNIALEQLYCTDNQLTSLNVSNNKELYRLSCYENKISGTNMTALVNSLPDRNGEEEGKFNVFDRGSYTEQNLITAAQAAVAIGRNWSILDKEDNPYTAPGDTPPGDLNNPLSYVAGYNVNPAGTGFVTSLTACNVSGYFTFDEAISKFNDITLGGKQYHLPSIEEWHSIVPINWEHVQFTKTESYNDIREIVTVQGAGIIMYSDFRTGVNRVSYALRYKGTDLISAWRYEYIENGNNTHLKITSRSLKGQTGVTVDDIAKPAFWNANADNDVIRYFPASGFSLSGSLERVGLYSYFWSSSPRCSVTAWNMSFNSRIASTYFGTHYYGYSVRLFASGD